MSVDQSLKLLAERRNLERAEAAQAAQQIWNGMTSNEKAGVRFGLFPAAKMQDGSVSHIDGRLLAVALMECAQRTGGMIA